MSSISGATAIGATIYVNDTGDDTEGGYQVVVSGGTASGTVITSAAIQSPLVVHH